MVSHSCQIRLMATVRHRSRPAWSGKSGRVERLKGLLQDTPTTLKKCTDGLSKTFMFFESAGRPNNYGPNKTLIIRAINNYARRSISGQI